jgi:hypothetical protein
MNDKRPIKRGLILNVPFAEKDKAKKLGAFWDPEIKKWFVPLGTDSAPFSEWIPKTDAPTKQKAA